MGQPSLSDMTVAAVDALNTQQNARALELGCRSITQYQNTGHLQRLVFTLAAERTAIPALVPQLKKAMELVLGHDDIENQRLFPGWFYIFQNTPLFHPLLHDPFDWKRIEPALQDKFLVEGVRNLNFLDWNLEKIFTRLRRMLLLEQFPQGALKTKHLPFLCALAEHCFYNEYVFAADEEELSAVSALTPENPVSVALIGCYTPLAGVVFDIKMSAVSGFRSLIQTQVGNIREEYDIASGFKAEIQDEVTRNVAAMYEENPYPRWRNINMPHRTENEITADILLAGCGTGRMALSFSTFLPNATFTAIDISRASLAYAARMAERNGINNITFALCSIMEADRLEKKFDYIECSGVLHHMENPEEGWRNLTRCLKEGGGMQIALYSAATRIGIDKVRNYIKEKGYKPTPDDIRKLRTDIAALPEGNPLKDVLRMRDFYSTSMVRDLVFHIQESSYDLSELDAMMKRLGLEFDGFKIDESIKDSYRARFGNDPALTDLANWAVFEKENPDTFSGMYRIFCHRKGEQVSDSVLSIRTAQI